MKFSATEDIDADIDSVFAKLSDFESFERAALRRGAEIERLSDTAVPDVGMTWKTRFEMRGRSREVSVRLSDYAPSSTMRFDATGQGMDGQFTLDLLALSPRRTRLSAVLLLKPKSLSSKMLVQSLKIARTSLTRKFRDRVSEFAAAIEQG